MNLVAMKQNLDRDMAHLNDCNLGNKQIADVCERYFAIREKERSTQNYKPLCVWVTYTNGERYLEFHSKEELTEWLQDRVFGIGCDGYGRRYELIEIEVSE